MTDDNPLCPYKPPTEKVKSVGSDEVVGEIEVAACGGKTTKIISRNSFQLKGEGWEADSYA